MNILIANTQEFNPQIGGVERVSTILAKEFQLLGHNVDFLACIKSPYSKDYTPVVPQKMLSNSNEFDSASNINELCSFLNDKEINIIINQAGNIKKFSTLCFEASRIYKLAKLVTVIHTDPIYRFRSLFDISTSILPSQKTYKNFARLLKFPFLLIKTYISDSNLYNFIYKNSDKVVLLSDQFKKDFKSITRLASYDKLIAIPNPFPFNIDCADNDTIKEKKILYLGRIDYGTKRADRILDIWSKLESDFLSWSIDIVGEGPIKQELIDLAKIRKIERVYFIDFVDPKKYYKRSEIICMTSTVEGLPMVLIEASYYGCIPLAFKSFSSLSDIITDNINGYMIKPYSLLEYEKKLRLLMENEELRRTIQIETMNIHKKFLTKMIITKWINLFDELLDKK